MIKIVNNGLIITPMMMAKFTDITIAIWLLLIFFHLSRVVIIQLSKKSSLWGKPSIKPWQFYSGKISLWLQWIIALLQLSGMAPLALKFPDYVGFIIIPLTIVSGVLLHFSHLEMSEALKPGIPENPYKLRTEGIYSITRNPMHLGAYLFGIACILYSFSIYNIILFLIMTSSHHKMVLAEEKYLKNSFGQQWDDYSKNTPRYILNVK